MKAILILYPEEFKCFSKFTRKVNKITRNMDNYSVIYPNDPNGFIELFISNAMTSVRSHKKENWSLMDITHAIIFDDGEEFPGETKQIKAAGIPLRLIKIPITRVINIKKDTKYKNVKTTPEYEYIGRGSYWGNPYSMHEDGEGRNEVIHKYKYDFERDLFPNKKKSEVYKLAGKKLGCFCKPEACHGDILAEFLNSWDDGK